LERDTADVRVVSINGVGGDGENLLLLLGTEDGGACSDLREAVTDKNKKLIVSSKIIIRSYK
jgi:hypothetical protein